MKNNNPFKKRKYFNLIIKILTCFFILIITTILSINFYVINKTRPLIINDLDYSAPNNIDCILVLGAGVWDNEPSPMLKERLDSAISLYNLQISPKIIMSGDHQRQEYDEVNVMKNYAISKGVVSSDVFMDHAGFSTYESIYRAKEVFDANNIIIVTQEYHLYRALFIASYLGINAYGVKADKEVFSGQTFRKMREILARNKDFVYTIVKPQPTYLGETIKVSGNGDVTNDY